MNRFLPLLLFGLFALKAESQNLIPNPSVEDYEDCPETLENIQGNVIPWLKLRGTPDYFNSCSENPLLGWNNSVGYQVPRTGNGYLGAYTFHEGLENGHEHFGVQLNSPLQIGETYFLSFWVSTAYKSNGFSIASNNIGCLLMTENYLSSDELGSTPNYSHFNLDETFADTLNWVLQSFSFVADSTYQIIAFGNFYDDENTEIEIITPDNGNDISYYFFDDFCLTTNSEGCPMVSSNKFPQWEDPIKIYPNPSHTHINIESHREIQELILFDILGRPVILKNGRSLKYLRFPEQISSGIYILKLKTEEGVIKKRIMVQN